jgi:hypothetical protein
LTSMDAKLATHQVVVTLQQTAPTAVAKLGGAASRVHDVREADGGQDPVGLFKTTPTVSKTTDFVSADPAPAAARAGSKAGHSGHASRRVRVRESARARITSCPAPAEPAAHV